MKDSQFPEQYHRIAHSVIKQCFLALEKVQTRDPDDFQVNLAVLMCQSWFDCFMSKEKGAPTRHTVTTTSSHPRRKCPRLPPELWQEVFHWLSLERYDLGNYKLCDLPRSETYRGYLLNCMLVCSDWAPIAGKLLWNYLDVSWPTMYFNAIWANLAYWHPGKTSTNNHMAPGYAVQSWNSIGLENQITLTDHEVCTVLRFISQT